MSAKNERERTQKKRANGRSAWTPIQGCVRNERIILPILQAKEVQIWHVVESLKTSHH